MDASYGRTTADAAAGNAATRAAAARRRRRRRNHRAARRCRLRCANARQSRRDASSPRRAAAAFAPAEWRLLHRHRRHSRRRSRRRRRRPSSTISSNSGARRLRALHRREHSRVVPAAFTGSSNTHSNHHSNRRRKWRHASISRRSTHRSIRDRTARRRCPLRPRPIHTHGRAVRRWPTCSNLRPSRPRRRAAVVPLLALCRVAIVKRCCAHRTSTHRRVQFAPRPSCHPPFLLRSPARGRCAGQRQPRLWSGSFYPGCRRRFLPSSPPRVDGRRCCPTARARRAARARRCHRAHRDRCRFFAPPLTPYRFPTRLPCRGGPSTLAGRSAEPCCGRAAIYVHVRARADAPPPSQPDWTRGVRRHLSALQPVFEGSAAAAAAADSSTLGPPPHMHGTSRSRPASAGRRAVSDPDESRPGSSPAVDSGEAPRRRARVRLVAGGVVQKRRGSTP